METKRKINQMGLKVAFIPQKNHNENRYKITQTNNGKSIFIQGNLDCEIIKLIEIVLNKIESIKSFNLVVDNSQNKHYLFSIDFVGNSFEDILNNFKPFK